MTPDPKKPRIKLSSTELYWMRRNIYNKQLECCANPKCGEWTPLEQFHLHHWKKTKGAGGDDTEDNLRGLCWKCHRKAHDGNIRLCFK